MHKNDKFSDFKTPRTDALIRELCSIGNGKDFDIELFLRPKEAALNNFISIVPSSSLTVFTYTIEKGFAKSVIDNIKQCTGDVTLVAQINKTTHFNHLCEQLASLSEQVESLTLYCVKKCHIKLFIRDDYAIIGSQNFTTGADSHPNTELFFISKSGGEQIKARLLSTLTELYSDFRPLELKGYSATEIADKITKATRSEFRKNALKEMLEQILENSKVAHFQIDSMEELVELMSDLSAPSFDDARYIDRDTIKESTEQFLEDFEAKCCEFLDEIKKVEPESTFQQYLEAFETAHTLLDDAFEDQNHILDAFHSTQSIDDIARDRTYTKLCEDGKSDPDTGEFDESAISSKELVKKIKNTLAALYEENVQTVNQYFESVLEEFRNQLDCLLEQCKQENEEESD